MKKLSLVIATMIVAATTLSACDKKAETKTSTKVESTTPAVGDGPGGVVAPAGTPGVLAVEPAAPGTSVEKKTETTTTVTGDK